MKQNIELFKKILSTIEDSGNITTSLDFEEYTKEQILYHCKCLESVGYIWGVKSDFGDSRVLEVEVEGITKSGKQFFQKLIQNQVKSD